MSMKNFGRFAATIILATVAFVGVVPAADAVWVNGYFRRDGTYVGGYYRSNPNGLRYDNYSYRLGQPLSNPSYGRYSTYRWNTPSWSWQDDYWSGLYSYRSSQPSYGRYGGSYRYRSSYLDDYYSDDGAYDY